MAGQGAESTGCETTHVFFSIFLPNIPEIRGEPLKLKLYGLRGDVERLGAIDTCVACANLILGNRASVTHSAMRTRRMQELLENGWCETRDGC